MNKIFILLIGLIIGFVAGLLIGEYRGCPEDKYSFEWGCER